MPQDDLFFLMPCPKASPCLIVLAHNEAKIVCLVPRLPLGGRLGPIGRW